MSPTVQPLPSSHGAELFVVVQPPSASQLSLVHGLPSSQVGAAPPTQVPPAQWSLVVQSLPSSHDTVLLPCVQPVGDVQPSSVQISPSSHTGGGPPTQVPPAQ